MKVLGIIAEYNPFHMGHLYHLNESKKATGATHTIAVMSGNFVQRGEPAIADKWTRAGMAVENGLDLVLEMPFAFASSSAEYFGEAGVRLLNALGIVDSISYGSESDCNASLKDLANLLVDENDEYKLLLRKKLSEGKSFPSAREEAISILRPQLKDLLNHSNNILAVEYLKAAKRIKSQIDFISVRRAGSSYNEKNISPASFSSATAIRKKIAQDGTRSIKKQLPPKSIQMLDSFLESSKSYPTCDDLYKYLKYRIIISNKTELGEIEGMREGLENLLKTAVYLSNDYESLINNMQSKRYPRSSLQRLFLHTLLGLQKNELENFRNHNKFYGRVLAFSNNGRQLLNLIKKQSDIELLTNINRQFPKDALLSSMLAYDIKATDFYMMLLKANENKALASQDKVKMPYIG